jgi:hypothetical protein
MNDISRRHFLGSAALLLASAALPFGRAHAAPAGSLLTAPLGKIHIIGLNDPPGRKPEGHASPSSVLTTLDLQTGQTRRTELLITDGHAALPLGGGRLACIAHHGPRSCVVDADHGLIATLDAPAGYLYGGHAIILPDRGVFVIPVRRAHQQTASDFGRFVLYDLGTLREIDQIEAAALHPHEMRLIPGAGEIAVTHYGDIHKPHPYFVHNAVAPKLVIYDAATLKEKRSYAQETNDAMLTHMSVTPDGHAWCVLTQYYKVNPDPSLPPQEQMESAYDAIRQATGKEPDFEILPQGVDEGRIAMPLPFLRIDTRTGKTEALMPEPDASIRSQSVACNQQTGAAAATYFHSNALIVQRPGKDAAIVTGKAIGIDGIRGVAELPETPFFVVTGSAQGAVILDSLTLEVIARFNVDNAHAPHVEYEST